MLLFLFPRKNVTRPPALSGFVRLETWVAKWRHHGVIDGQLSTVTQGHTTATTSKRPLSCSRRGQVPHQYVGGDHCPPRGKLLHSHRLDSTHTQHRARCWFRGQRRPDNDQHRQVRDARGGGSQVRRGTRRSDERTSRSTRWEEQPVREGFPINLAHACVKTCANACVKKRRAFQVRDQQNSFSNGA